MPNSITPGQVWLDTTGNRIHVHAGSIIAVGQSTACIIGTGEQAALGARERHLALGRAVLLVDRPLQSPIGKIAG